ncbi:S24 family peptidase [Methanobrevibacter filiformis]|uniref:LexA repressor n=1 Tax=Methanobrevibacter filiformis TaxID=55758 RepID=A0A166C420_9EURY|nr:S24 family peptidase [Methanobrevibacter filiformis]KZX14106.1 LexA repressor [Methanobrevibacter filiformis]
MNKRITIIASIVIIIAIIGGLTVVFSDDAVINVKLDGVNVSTEVLSIPFNGKDNSKLEQELHIFIYKQVNNISTNATTIEEDIKKISEKYGYTDIDVNLHSQFGDNTLPMIVLVDGTSMVPTLKDGEKIIIEKDKNVKPGDIVVANDNQYGLIIKRVNKTKGNQIYLVSDNKKIETVIENGVIYEVSGIKTWVNKSQIVGIAKQFNV